MNPLLATIATLATAAAAAPTEVAPPVRSLLSEATEMQTTTPLWPGFEPGSIPVAIYDGEHTWLAGHPQPPEGFSPVEPGVQVMPGRHPSVSANTGDEIGGVLTATLLADRDLDGRGAGILIHEKFHVFQRREHPDWIADEAALFTYPAEDAEVLAHAFAEMERLEAALAMGSDDEAACQAGAAVRLRERRFELLEDDAARYERATELNEGLAQYVEDRASGRGRPRSFERRADAVRQRAYGTGAAYAHLLDRLSPDWKQALETRTQPLDQLMADAVAGIEHQGCLPDEQTMASHRTSAVESVAALDRRRSQLRRQFLAQTGRTVVIESASPLWPAGFDPINVTRLGPGAILHSRMVKLSNDRADIQVIGHAVITEAAGEHPLFDGVRRVTIAGLEDLEIIGAGVPDTPIRLEAEGLSITVRDGRFREGDDGETVYLSL